MRAEIVNKVTHWVLLPVAHKPEVLLLWLKAFFNVIAH